MLAYSEVKPGRYIALDGEPYEVLSSHVFRKQMRKPVNQVKMRNLMTGKVAERSFHQSETIEEAEIENSEMNFIYCSRGQCWFAEPGNPKNRISLSEEMLGDQKGFMKEGMRIKTLVFNSDIIAAVPPVKVELLVKEAPPSIKGNTSQGGTKPVVLETGATVNTPLFVNTGDTIRVNTETGEYVERVEKGA